MAQACGAIPPLARRRSRAIGGLSLFLIVSALAVGNLIGAPVYKPSLVSPPKVMRETRAAWVATVNNIDWPSTNGLSSAQEKAELLAILDRAVQLKLNTIIFQVRPSCDALYRSSLEPWSEYLTGMMGRAPEPFYDPLAFVVEEAHRRGLELHAWFNPYRARHSSAKSPISPGHISKTHPELVRQYGKSLWLDPGDPAVQEHCLAVIMDVVKRYDIDGVHFDDYFYPYKEKNPAGREVDFPDEVTWQRYGRRSRLNREDWRRENVNQFVRSVYRSIKAVKPWVKFGISPFGIWRPKNPPQIEGLDAYAKLYADSRLWLANGWLDYCAPQLYWGINPPEQSFPVLLKWWAEQNPKGRELVPGLASARIGQRWKPEEIVAQIRLTRKQSGTSGHIHWDMKALMQNNGLNAALEREVYTQAALVPPTPWLGHTTLKPHLSVYAAGASLKATWECPKPDQVHTWLLQFRIGKAWTAEILPAQTMSRNFSHALPEVLALSAIDRYGDTSRATVLELASQTPSRHVELRRSGTSESALAKNSP